MDGLTRDEVISLLRNQIADLYNLAHERNQYHGAVAGAFTTADVNRMLERAMMFNKLVDTFDIGGAI